MVRLIQRFCRSALWPLLVLTFAPQAHAQGWAESWFDNVTYLNCALYADVAYESSSG